ncbi:hypothetical protein BH10PSE16_BH10PSE16_05130 [soil metagenome]
MRCCLFVAYDGTHATSAGDVKDAQGATEAAAEIGEVISVITGYWALVEANEAIAFGASVKPAADGNGKAVVGAVDEHCGRALGAATAAGQLIEVQIVKHQHADVEI